MFSPLKFSFNHKSLFSKKCIYADFVIHQTPPPPPSIHYNCNYRKRCILAGKLTEATLGRQQLDERLRESQRELRESQREMQEAQAAASKYEAELEALSRAYTSIEAHAHGLEAQLAARTGNGLAPQTPGKGMPMRTAQILILQ